MRLVAIFKVNVIVRAGVIKSDEKLDGYVQGQGHSEGSKFK